MEFAAELRDFVKGDLQKYYPPELIEKAQITLVDGLDKVLNTFSEEVSFFLGSFDRLKFVCNVF